MGAPAVNRPNASDFSGDDADREPRRTPALLETNVPGVFAAGDVRSGSTKRVASAVGEGAMAIRQIHEYFGT